MVDEILVELENTPGSLIRATQALEDEGVDIRGLNVSQGSGLSQVRMVVDKTDQALQILQGQGLEAQLTKAIGIWVEDEPGSLNPLLEAFAEAQENIQFIYPFFKKGGGNIGVVINADDIDSAKQVLQGKGISIIADGDI